MVPVPVPVSVPGFGQWFACAAATVCRLLRFSCNRASRTVVFFQPSFLLCTEIATGCRSRRPSICSTAAQPGTRMSEKKERNKSSTLSFQHRLMSAVICVSVTVRVLSSFTLCVYLPIWAIWAKKTESRRDLFLDFLRWPLSFHLHPRIHQSAIKWVKKKKRSKKREETHSLRFMEFSLE